MLFLNVVLVVTNKPVHARADVKKYFHFIMRLF